MKKKNIVLKVVATIGRKSAIMAHYLLLSTKRKQGSFNFFV